MSDIIYHENGNYNFVSGNYSHTQDIANVLHGITSYLYNGHQTTQTYQKTTVFGGGIHLSYEGDELWKTTTRQRRNSSSYSYYDLRAHSLLNEGDEYKHDELGVFLVSESGLSVLGQANSEFLVANDVNVPASLFASFGMGLILLRRFKQ